MAIKILVTRYQAECGHRFSRKASAEGHEQRATCWKLPVVRTCLTCVHTRVFWDSYGVEGSPRWRDRECQNPAMEPEDFKPAHDKAQNVCIGCPKWEAKA
jgi:hypothetical protein